MFIFKTVGGYGNNKKSEVFWKVVDAHFIFIVIQKLEFVMISYDDVVAVVLPAKFYPLL